MRIHISIENKLLKKFDEFCTVYNFDRSELISALMRTTVYDLSLLNSKDISIMNAKILSNKIAEGKIKKKEVLQEEVNPKGEMKPIMVTPKITDLDFHPKREQVWENRSEESIYAQISFGYCQNHFEQGKKFKLYLIVYENENGIGTVKKWMCENCKNQWIEKAEKVGNIIST